MKERKGTEERLKNRAVRVKSRPGRLKCSESEQKSVADMLPQSETMFRKLIEKSIVGVYLIQDDVFQYVNPKMAEIHDCKVDDLVDKLGPKMLVFSEDWPLVEGNLKKRLSGEVEAINYRFRGVKASGEIIHLEVYGTRTEYRGRPAVIGIMLDITHRVEAERKLQTQLHRFQVLYHIAVGMAAERSLKENLAVLADKCRDLLETDVALVAISDESLENILVYAQSGLRRAQLNRLPLKFLKKQRLPISPDRPGDEAEECFNMLNRFGKRVFQGECLVSGIAIPLRIGKEAVAVLCVGSRSKKVFSESEMGVLSLVGNIAALEITRKRAEEALARSEDQLRRLSAQLLRAQEDERKRLAQELHDAIGQSLSAIKFKIETSMKQIREHSGSGHTTDLDLLVPMIQNTVEEVQRIAMDLRPSILDDLGLIATLGWFLRQFQSTYSNMRLECGIGLREHEIPEPLKIVIFRIAQEALNNVARHSRAEQVHVALRKRKDRIELLIRDNGVGVDRDSIAMLMFAGGGRGFGLAGMKERTELSGGTFRLDSTPRQGTSITASWPFKTLVRRR